jgi:hypothetical protein
VTVAADPRFEIPDADRVEKWTAILRAGALQETATEAITRIVDLRADLESVRRKTRLAQRDRQVEAEGDEAEGEKGPYAGVLRAVRAVEKRLDEIEKSLRVPPKTKGIVDYGDASGKIRYASSALGSSWDAPTSAQQAYLSEAETVLAKALTAINELFAKEVAVLKIELGNTRITLLPAREELKLP